MNCLGAAWRAHEAALRQWARHCQGAPAQADDRNCDKITQWPTAAGA